MLTFVYNFKVEEAKKRVNEKLENEKKLQKKKQEIKQMTLNLLNQQVTQKKVHFMFFF